MEPRIMRLTDELVQLYDEEGRLIGTIVRPVVTDVIGPGAEKVYLARRAERLDRNTQHAA